MNKLVIALALGFGAALHTFLSSYSLTQGILSGALTFTAAFLFIFFLLFLAEKSLTRTKTCPFCAETIKSQATVCRFCGREQPTYAPPKTQTP